MMPRSLQSASLVFSWMLLTKLKPTKESMDLASLLEDMQ
ncbi:hypothetical protein KC19_2G092500 [Ceratodon purpureus]|uniref:Uncharacterized protein n=1 Tax=Ceratodon purpureus TaxID=3225 RepID=A0A8T0ITP3_CERPU|nr:hypothetical protein KC19_2G092500 [Ceratodon purpureus]